MLELYDVIPPKYVELYFCKYQLDMLCLKEKQIVLIYNSNYMELALNRKSSHALDIIC